MNRPLITTWYQIAVGILLMIYVSERLINDFVDSMSDDEVDQFLEWIRHQGLM